MGSNYCNLAVADFLPKPQVQASPFQVHISHLLQKCKKGKPPEKSICPIGNSRYEIKAKMLAVSKVFRPVDILTILLQITALPKPEIRE